MNKEILKSVKCGDKLLVRDVRNFLITGYWDRWYEATVIKIIKTNRSHSVQVRYEDMKGEWKDVTSTLVGGIVRALDTELANALSMI